MNDDQKYAVARMYDALADFLEHWCDPNMPMQSLLEHAAQAAPVSESAFPELKEKA